MAAGFTMLLAKLAAIIGWFGDLATAVFTAAWDLLRDAVCWPFEQMLDLVIAAVGALDLSGLSAASADWGSLPGEIINALGILRVGEAAAIIVAAITIRLTLQLIPFTRLGS